MSGRTCTTTTRVRFGETDAAGIVFYPTFFAWFDLGTHALLRAATGAQRGEGGRPRWPLPIVESGARFKLPLFYDDEIAIRSSVVKIGGSSLRVEHSVLRAGIEVASGFEVRVHMRRDGDHIAAEPIPQELRDALTPEIATQDLA